MKQWIKSLLATVAVLVLLMQGTYSLDKRRKILDGKFYAFFHPDKKIEYQVKGETFRNDNFVSNDADTIIDDKIGDKTSDSTDLISEEVDSKQNFPTFEINDDSSEYDKHMAKSIEQSTKVSENIRILSSEKVVSISEQQILDTLNAKLLEANSSLFAVSQYINGRESNGTGFIIDFENDFDKEFDKVVVNAFSQGRNMIVASTFNHESPEEIKEMIKNYYEFIEKFVISRETCTFEFAGKSYNIQFDDLSDVAQYVVGELCKAMLSQISYGDLTNNKEMADIIEKILSELVKKIVNKGYSKDTSLKEQVIASGETFVLVKKKDDYFIRRAS